jgi:molecular chaperone DnaK (HSP70)
VNFLVLKNNATIPTKTSQSFSTKSFETSDLDGKNRVVIKIFEGNHSKTRDNKFLGQVELIDIPLTQDDAVFSIEVTLDVDANYQISISAECKVCLEGV